MQQLFRVPSVVICFHQEREREKKKKQQKFLPHSWEHTSFGQKGKFLFLGVLGAHGLLLIWMLLLVDFCASWDWTGRLLLEISLSTPMYGVFSPTWNQAVGYWRKKEINSLLVQGWFESLSLPKSVCRCSFLRVLSYLCYLYFSGFITTDRLESAYFIIFTTGTSHIYFLTVIKE